MKRKYPSSFTIFCLCPMLGVAVVGCSASLEGASSSGGGATMSRSDSDGPGSTGSTTGTGNGLDPTLSYGTAGGEEMKPVRLIPKLVSITFYERTGGAEPTASTFDVDGTELGKRLDDPLTDTNSDIQGAIGEYYDVYYSNADGAFAPDGSYLTISGIFDHGLPAGGGLNLAEIGLNFQGVSTEYGNYVASYVAFGDNKNEDSVKRCIDSDLQTHTTMGNTLGSAERLRLTLGFKSSSGLPK